MQPKMTKPKIQVELATQKELDRRAKISKSLTGVPKTETQKQKMSDAKMGKAKSEQHRKAMLDAQRRRRLREREEKNQKENS